MQLTSKEFVLQTMADFGHSSAKAIQDNADSMTGTELYDREGFIPSFTEAVKVKNMIDREIGFTCKSPSGRIVRLIQPYDSDIYTDDPEDLVAQWGFKWSTDPSKALPFIAMATSPYMKDDCCTDNGVTYKSKIDNNVHSPSDYPNGWEEV